MAQKHKIPSYINEDAQLSQDDVLRWFYKHSGHHRAYKIKSALGIKSDGEIYTRLDRMRLWGLVTRTRTRPYEYTLSDWGLKYARDQKIV